MSIDKILLSFISKNRLPKTYFSTAVKWFLPIIDELKTIKRSSGQQIIVGINGCQGSGKSTLAKLLIKIFIEKHDLNSVCFSLDDFYHTKKKRLLLSKEVHPLLVTRGVPGTHDIEYLEKILESLRMNQKNIEIPKFNKINDDREMLTNASYVKTPVDIIVIEGWCLGIKPQELENLSAPINILEEKYDEDGIWRSFVNSEQASSYQKIFDKIDIKIMLEAPAFNCVYDWRLQQENELRNIIGKEKKEKLDSEFQFFIQHFERLTKHALETLPDDVNYLLKMKDDRSIVECKKPI